MSDDEFSAETFRTKKREEKIQAKIRDAELDAINAQAKQVQGDSLESTRRALQKIKETEDIGAKTMGNLAQQGEMLEHADKGMDRVKSNLDQAQKDTTTLHRFDGMFTFFSRKGKKEKAENDAELQEKLSKIDKGSKKAANAKIGGVARGEKAEYEDEAEQEIDENLGEISGVLGNMAIMSETMGGELDKQEITMQRIDVKTVHAERAIDTTSKSLDKFL